MDLLSRTDYQEASRSREAVRVRSLALREQACALYREVRAAHTALVDAVEATRATLRSVRSAHAARIATPAAKPCPSPSSALLQALAASGLDQGDLDDITHDLIAAYRDAVARDEGELVTLLGGTLRVIGQHLGERMGPRAAGVLLN